MSKLRGFLIASLALSLAGSALASTLPQRTITRLTDRATLTAHLKAKGFKSRGGVDKGTTDRDERSGRGFPHFTSSFSVGGVTYPFTMVGYRPESGRSSSIKTVIIPLRMNFSFFGENFDVSHSFEPGPAVMNSIRSPMYVPAPFPNGVGQFGDQLQRAAFWNRMDARHSWHVRLADPAVEPTIDIYVTPEIGTLTQDAAGNYFGDVLIDFLDSQAQTIIQLLNLGPDTLPIFITNGVTAEALGYHTAYTVSGPGGQPQLQTYIFTTWLDPALVDPLFADVSTFNHELAEWLNDPFVNNATPDWYYPPASDPATTCSGNPFLEVGDPQGNGPTYPDFPTVPVTLSGVTYHLQQVVLWQWFADEVPSSAYGGWYTFPQPTGLTAPAVYCP